MFVSSTEQCQGAEKYIFLTFKCTVVNQYWVLGISKLYADIAKLIFNFNFNLNFEDEIALILFFSSHPTTQTNVYKLGWAGAELGQAQDLFI